MSKTLLCSSARKLFLLITLTLFFFQYDNGQAVFAFNDAIAAPNIIYSGLGKIPSTQRATPPLSASAVQTNVSCHGGSNGSATVTVTGGLPPYDVNWDHALGSSATISGLTPDTYTCTITDDNFDITTVSVTITEPALLTTSVSHNDVSCHGGTNGTATVVTTGGTAPYSYSWSPSGGTGATASGLGAGTYTCTITDNNGCTTTNSATIAEPVLLSATTSQINISCHGASNGSAAVMPIGGTSPYSYSWSPSGGTAATASGLAPGSYSCLVTDNNGCTATRSFTLTEPAALGAATVVTNISCYGAFNGSAQILATGGTPPYAYSWAPSGGTGATASSLGAGTYTCIITDNNGCATTKTVVVSQPAAALSATTSQTNVLCNGSSTGSATVTVSGGTAPYSYSWSPSGGTGATASNLSSGAYTCTITDANLCSTTQTFTITEPATLASAKVLSLISCHGNSDGGIQYNVTGGTAPYTYSWSPNVSTTNSASSLAVGTYTCIITDANGCTLTKTETLTEPTAMVVTPSQTNVSCFGGSNGTAIVSVSGGAGNYSYSWSPSGGTAATATGLSAGTYTCTITDDNFCTATATFNITEATATAVTITSDPSDQSITEGHNTSFSIASIGATSYQWQVDMGSGYSDLTETSIYSGTTTAQLSITGAIADMNGYHFRCIAADACAVSATSQGALLTVNPMQDQTITFALLDSVEYGSSDILLDATSTSGLAVQYSSSDNAIASASGGTLMIHKAGTVDITATQAGDDNYNPAMAVTQTLVINPKTISVALSSSPQITKAYDGNNSASLSLQNYSLPGIVGSDHVTVSGTATYDDANAGEGKEVTVAGIVLGGADKDNYILNSTTEYTVGDISPKEITVNFNSSPAISKQYDGTNMATVTDANYTVSGVVGGEDLQVTVMATYNNKHAGSKVVTGINMLGGSAAANYQLGNGTETISGIITPRPVQVTAGDATKIYGSADPTLVYNITGLLGDDELSGSVQRSEGNNVGTYPIDTGTLGGNVDYSIGSFTPGVFTITRAPLVITADDQSKQQGQDNPTFTIQYSGFVLGDHAASLSTAAVVSTSALKNSPMGYYDLNVGGATSPNYDIIYKKGMLTILPVEGEMLKAWKSSSITMDVRIYSDRTQSAMVTLRGTTGQALTAKKIQLVQGINKTTLSIGSLAAGVYVVSVGADSFKQAVQVWVR